MLDFAVPPEGGPRRMRLRSVHPGVTVDDVVASTGFALLTDDPPEITRLPTAEELRLVREVLDPKGLRKKELAS